MWDKLKDLYQGTDKRKAGQMRTIVYDFSCFAQQEGETLFDCYTRYCILVDDLRKHGVEKQQMELNILFLKALRPEWKATCTMIMAHEHVDEYSLTDMYDLLKNHEAKLGLNNAVVVYL